MKKRFFMVITGAAALLCLLGGCDFFIGPDSPGGSGQGNLSISFGTLSSPGRSITAGQELPGELRADFSYRINLTGPEGRTLTRTVPGETSLKLTVALGEWRIDVEAYLEDGLAGTGSRTFTVVPGENPVSIPMKINGGYFDITVDPVAGRRIRANFAAAFPGTTVTLELKPDKNSLIKENTLRVLNMREDTELSLETLEGGYSFTMPASEVAIAAEFVDFVRYVNERGSGSESGLSWEDASSDLQKMMDELADLYLDPAGYAGPYIVKLAAGTYRPFWTPQAQATEPSSYVYLSGGQNASFILRSHIQLWGAYPAEGGDDSSRNPGEHPSILNGDAGTEDVYSDDIYHVLLGIGILPNTGTILDGLSIRGGNAGNNSSYHVGSFEISGSKGGGLYNYASSPELINVTISGNSALDGGGGIYNHASSPVLTNVIISGNSALDGAGIYNHNSSPVLTNATIAGNKADTAGGGIYNGPDSSPRLRNSIVWGNLAGTEASGIYNDAATNQPVIAYSIVEGSNAGGFWTTDTIPGPHISGGGNREGDPLFAGWLDPSAGGWAVTSGGNYRLGNGSPAVNGGYNGYYDTPELSGVSTDPDGAARILGGTVDMGAYEKQ